MVLKGYAIFAKTGHACPLRLASISMNITGLNSRFDTTFDPRRYIAFWLQNGEAARW